MFDLPFWQIAMRVLAAVVIFTCHGAALALFARLLGDRGPQYDGRLTLNPFAHVEPFGTLAAVAARGGWARPMAIDANALRAGRAGLVICALAALAVTLALAHGAIALRPLVLAWWPAATSPQAFAWIGTFADLSVWFVIFNLAPLPPLTGGLLLAALLPALHRRLWAQVQWIGVGLAALLALTRGGGVHSALQPLARLIAP